MGRRSSAAAADNIFNVPSIYAFQPLISAGTGSNTVNIGTGTLSNIAGAVTVSDSAVINIDDDADTTHATATLDDLSGNVNAPFRIDGPGKCPHRVGRRRDGRQYHRRHLLGGAAGVTFDINNTQAGTTTTINGGPNRTSINLSNAGEAGGLDNLPGPVVDSRRHELRGRRHPERLRQSARSTTITSSRARRFRGRFFGGLTYDDNIGTLTLLAENTLGTNGNNVIDINSTADFVITNINGQGGVDTINVNDTGIFGVLNVTTGADDGSTVNVVADNEPVNITGGAVATVNIGSTGGPGTMANIQGPISVTNPPSFTDLNFHDENDTTGQTWTLDNDDGVPSAASPSPAAPPRRYNPFDLCSLTVNGGSGGNTFNVNNTSAFYPTTLNTGTGDDTINVLRHRRQHARYPRPGRTGYGHPGRPIRCAGHAGLCSARSTSTTPSASPT